MQATSTHHDSLHKPLTAFFTSASLLHVGDPLTPIFIPTNSPLNHGLIRIPIDVTSLPPTTSTSIAKYHYDHIALHGTILQIGDLHPQAPSPISTFPMTRDHPPFILPIIKLFIDLYQLRDDVIRTTHHAVSLVLQQLHNTKHNTTIDHIDKLPNLSSTL